MLVRLLRTYLSRYRGLLVIVLVLQFIQAMATLTLPSLNADIIDNGVVAKDTAYILRMGAVMLAVTLVQIIFAIAATYFSARVAMAFGRDVRGELFHRVTSFSSQEVDRLGAPSLITRITNDVTQVQVLVLMGCTMLLAAPIMATGGVVMAIREDGPLSLILLVSIPALAVSVGSVVIRLVPQFEQMQERIDRVNRVLREQIVGLRVVRAFVREPFERERFGRANDELTVTSLRAGKLMAFMFPSVMLVMNLSSAGALLVGANRVGSRAMPIGALIAFLAYLVQILMSVMMATFVAVLWPRAAVSAERIQEVLDTQPSITNPEPAVAVCQLSERNTVEFVAVGFRYPGAEAAVLTDVSFVARPGEVTAIVGSTGSGKSTLLSLVPRLFDVTEGAVRIDGVDVRDLDLEVLWSHIGLVPQKPYLFSGTVASNLRHSKPDATDDELWEALTIAQAADFVRAMPGGLDAPINQGGTNVSGGQRQRLAIARAIVRRPSIYLFDDSFSALDLATDARLRAALAPVTAHATVLVVAQRISTIAQADQILVLDDGRVVGLGQHDQLLATCSTYREIVESQLRTGAVA
ncbi:MAG: ABC transporter ATP-binding protein/permease [Acidimicrobiales bacterium]|nr:ABC transporter ATP-binding protein/permease [Acidimicrobiales bacterium]